MTESNQKITFKGNPIKVSGCNIRVGDKAPNFQLTGTDLEDVIASSFQGKVLILSVVPSLDTPVCSEQTKRFNKEATKLSKDVKILTVSLDLPFAQKRFCAAESIDQVQTASDYKYRSFGESFGVYLPDLGILARAVFVVDKTGIVKYVEYVPEIASEPNYDAALTKVAELLG